MTINYKRINDVIPSWMTDGIFSALEQFDVPWKETTTATVLDVAYHGSHSGDKIVSPLIDKMLDDGALSSENITKIAEVIFTVYGNSWVKLWNTLTLEYDPIQNYSMTETESRTGSSSGTDTIQDNANDTQSTIASNTNGVYAFNSSSPSNADVQNGNGTVTDTRTSNTTSTNSDTHSDTRTMTRSGNIGVTTSQQMIASERELWNWFFYDVVFKNIDAIMTLSIY